MKHQNALIDVLGKGQTRAALGFCLLMAAAMVLALGARPALADEGIVEVLPLEGIAAAGDDGSSVDGSAELTAQFATEDTKTTSDGKIMYGYSKELGGIHATYIGKGKSVTVPARLGGKKVVSFASYNGRLTSVNLKKAVYLKRINVSDNKIKKLDLSKNTRLVQLYCSNNRLTKIDVSKCAKLDLLSCSDNKLKTLDVTKNKKLTGLSCRANKLTKLNVTGNTRLQYLGCDYNKLASLNVTKNTKLQELDCSHNKIAKLSIKKNTKLETLYCGYNKLTSLSFATNKKLSFISCFKNKFNEKTMAALKKWEEGDGHILYI